MAEFFRFSDGAVKREDTDVMMNAYNRLKNEHKAAVKDLVFGAIIGLITLLILPRWLSWALMMAVSIIFSASFFGSFMKELKQRPRVEARRKAVLITGCDTGFGYRLARKLDDTGFQVFACCLLPDSVDAKSLKNSSSNRLHVIGMDVTSDRDVEKAYQYVTENLGNNKLWAVVCNAGINDGGEVLWTKMDTLQKIVDVNFLGTIRTVKAFLPLLCNSKGRVVATASAAGRLSFVGMAAYCSTKSGVIAFCDVLRTEMYKFGVQVVTVEPYVYRTAMADKTVLTESLKKTWDEAPQEIKAFYPPNYLDTYIQHAHKFIDDLASSNPSEVVECLEEAVAAEQPKSSYSPGTKSSRALFWVLRRLPKPIFDFIILGPSLKKGK